MYIKRFQLKNHKSFRDSGPIQFGPSFNIVVGPNNVGKTALLQALSMKYDRQAHRSPDYKSDDDEYRLVVALEKKDVFDLLEKHDQKIYLQVDRHNTSVEVPHWQELFENIAKHTIDVEYGIRKNVWQWAELSEYAFPKVSNGSQCWVVLLSYSDATDKFSVKRSSNARSFSELMTTMTIEKVKGSIYYFLAERYKIGQAPIKPQQILTSDASNLPTVLHHLLSSRRWKFEEYVHDVQKIFPDIVDISVPPINDKTTMIKMWYVSPEHYNETYTIPLSECGNGIAQVLSILYLVFMSEEPRVILIDEPQSFLHPGAIRKLFDLLHKYQKKVPHQFIIATHSPLVINVARPSSIVLLEKHGLETKAKQIDMEANDQAEAVLLAVGARLSDIFGADSILWVEGPTEEKCFPLILHKLGSQRLLGTEILGLLNTGDTVGKLRNRMRTIYHKLSTGNSLVPPTVAFILDGETLSQEQKEEYIKESGEQYYFLDRRMYENYLLHPNALAHVINGLDGFREDEVTSDEIKNWITNYLSEKLSLDYEDETWNVTIDGAKVLKDLFSQLSDAKYEYDKIEYGTLIAR